MSDKLPPLPGPPVDVRPGLKKMKPGEPGEPADRLKALAGLLKQGSFSKEEIAVRLPVYTEVTRRSLERDLLNLAKAGYDVVAERRPGSRFVSYRLAQAPARTEPIPERAWLDAWHETLLEKDDETLTQIKEFLGVGEVAKVLGLTVRRVTEFCKSGRLKSQKVGRRYIVHRQDVTEFAKIERFVGKRLTGPPGNG